MDLLTLKDKLINSRITKILLDVFVIFFSVTLSIYFNNWDEDRKQNIEVDVFFTDLKEDLLLDIESMEEHKKALEDMFVQTTAVYDTLNKIALDEKYEINNNLYITFIYRKTNNGTFEGFKSSGKMGSISDNTIKKDILKYYQSNMKEQEDIEKMMNDRVNTLLNLVSSEDDTKKYRRKLLMNLWLTNLSINGLLESYKRDIEFANKIINEI